MQLEFLLLYFSKDMFSIKVKLMYICLYMRHYVNYFWLIIEVVYGIECKKCYYQWLNIIIKDWILKSIFPPQCHSSIFSNYLLFFKLLIGKKNSVRNIFTQVVFVLLKVLLGFAQMLDFLIKIKIIDL